MFKITLKLNPDSEKLLHSPDKNRVTDPDIDVLVGSGSGFQNLFGSGLDIEVWNYSKIESGSGFFDFLDTQKNILLYRQSVIFFFWKLSSSTFDKCLGEIKVAKCYIILLLNMVENIFYIFFICYIHQIFNNIQHTTFIKLKGSKISKDKAEYWISPSAKLYL